MLHAICPAQMNAQANVQEGLYRLLTTHDACRYRQV
jgi:hypothetical protein